MSPSSPPAILLVDDNPAIFTMYREVLPALSGFTILTALNGVAALELLEQLKHAGQSLPACIVIDVMMPELNGIQLVRALRGDPETADIPLIILTALAQDKDTFLGLASGADQYLTKPVSVDTLLNAVRTAMTLSSETRAQRLQQLAEPPETAS